MAQPKKNLALSKKKVARKPPSLLRDTRGLTTVEYIIILCLIAVVGFAVWQKFGQTVKDKVGGADAIMDTLPDMVEM